MASFIFASSSAVPDRAIVPIRSTTSWRDMPIPLSRTVRIRWSESTAISMCRSETSAVSSLWQCVQSGMAIGAADACVRFTGSINRDT